MSAVSLVVLGLLAAALIYAIMLYNGLVALKHNVAKAWANIDVLLKQRHDELPKLVEVCRQYKQFEQDTLQRVIEARSQVQSARETQDVGALGEAEGALRLGLGKLFAVAEATRNYEPTKISCSSSSASRRWRTASPTGGSCTTMQSTSTTSVSTSSPIRSSPTFFISKKNPCLNFHRLKNPTSI